MYRAPGPRARGHRTRRSRCPCSPPNAVSRRSSKTIGKRSPVPFPQSSHPDVLAAPSFAQLRSSRKVIQNPATLPPLQAGEQVVLQLARGHPEQVARNAEVVDNNRGRRQVPARSFQREPKRRERASSASPGELGGAPDLVAQRHPRLLEV
eukprot:5152701-Pyramimonas_sp.AAC.1